MSLSTVPSEEAKAQAAEWFARLNRRDVSSDDMEAFRLWRKAPGHKEAYDAVDAFWRKSQALKNDPDLKAALAGAVSRTAPAAPSRRPMRLGYGLAFGLLLLAGAGGGYALWAPKTYATAIGEQRTIRLADGSTLTLDTGSKARVRLGKARRDIELVQGQALFEVAHDAARPFTVTAGDTAVTALGTRFDVRRDGAGASVTLVRGAVEVREASGATPRVWRLTPGQKVSTAAPTPAPVTIDAAAATSWTTGRLEFRNVALGAAVAEFNRYERRRIELAQGPWLQDRVSGVFDVDDTETFVRSIAELHDLEVSHPSKSVIRLARAGDGVEAR
ncbi:FecR domain-containing protein [Caulobacter sp.]|uniref:FecR family protein n=1 Tax=Caulobacter sp. TaxID=78 RepID=UPI0025C02EB2|nr:FecR domain-containing protein [Caulobacter sp.]MBQ1560927.1 FecR domain-containing protein [Caulobacter sp.]